VSARDPLAPAEVRDHVDTLAAILFDCVDGGPSVSYMGPFTLVGPAEPNPAAATISPRRVRSE
jgi:hypothetical protein